MALSFLWTHGLDIFNVAYEFLGILQGSLSLRLTHIILLFCSLHFFLGQPFTLLLQAFCSQGGKKHHGVTSADNSHWSQEQDLCFSSPKSSKPYISVPHPDCLTIRIVWIFARGSLGNISWGLRCPNRTLDVGNTAPPWTCERFHMDSSPSFGSALRVFRRYPPRF